MKELQTELHDRILRFDGVSIIEPELVHEYITRGISPLKLRVTSITPEIEQFNEQVADHDKFQLAQHQSTNINLEWKLPTAFAELVLDAYVLEVFELRLAALGYTSEQTEAAYQRVSDELDQITRMGMTQFMRTVAYVLHVFRQKSVLWGVGRGSSCASYILFILGLHVVDCVKYDIPMEEFFHT